ncbi:MAG TPA: hypothetical protein VN671_00420, partial [Solirubrobacterales bacterium]|nr:hypothetical protein [Solirubrobacterales bacterium]
MAPNPEAIAWYLKRSEGLLGDLRSRIESLRTRGAQLAGFSGAVLALAGANVESALDALHGLAREAAGGSLLVGSLLLIASLAVALRATLLPPPDSDVSVTDVANYTADRLTHEPDLWRVHVRELRGLLVSIESTSRQIDKTARQVGKAEYFFLAGLFTVGVAFAT